MTLLFFAHVLWWATHLFCFFLVRLTFPASFLLRFKLNLSRLFFSIFQWSSGNRRSSLGLKKKGLSDDACINHVLAKSCPMWVVCKANCYGGFKSQGTNPTCSLVQACWINPLQKLQNPFRPLSPSAPFWLTGCRFGGAALVLQTQTSSIRLFNSFHGSPLLMGPDSGSQGTDPHPCNDTGTLGQKEQAELMHDNQIIYHQYAGWADAWQSIHFIHVALATALQAPSQQCQ